MVHPFGVHVEQGPFSATQSASSSHSKHPAPSQPPNAVSQQCPSGQHSNPGGHSFPSQLQSEIPVDTQLPPIQWLHCGSSVPHGVSSAFGVH